MGSLCNFKLLLLSVYVLVWTGSSLSDSGDHRPYIIHMDKSAMPDTFSTHHDWYISTLSLLSSSDGDAAPIHLYTYDHVLDGFSAVLSKVHVDELHKIPGHVATYPDTTGHLHTTHSPKFLGLKKRAGIWPAAGFGNDIIVGVLDTGIWPESESFNDEGMPPVPARWRGECETGTEFNTSHCNRKLIGARSFSKGMKHQGLNVSTTDDYDSPRDFFGHGTHTSSTAAGSRVLHADYFGYAEGTATGIAPMARIAMYKVIFSNDDNQFAASDVLAGMDQAIKDGVDVMSLSLGFIETEFDQNAIAIGAFGAIRKGIFVACSAGNQGPHAYTILNGAPWITTIGAGTIDRDYTAYVTLGDNDLTVTGRSIYPENLYVSEIPIYFGHGNRSKEICDTDSLDPKDVAGKYIFCAFDYDGYVTFTQPLSELSRTGAAGAIISSDSGQFVHARDFNIPFVMISPDDGNVVKQYMIHSENTTVSIKFQITVLGTTPAPQVADFSSRGPDKPSPWILKPDILAPGVDILASWVPNRGWQPIQDQYLLNDYALVSGTSMSCPHVAGIAALIKAVHRNWTSAAIRSAMMTTANVYDNANGIIIDSITGIAGTPLDFGAGHVNPNSAMDPGLVYDLEVEDYINYLCALNCTTAKIRVVTGTSNFSCENANLDLNYPSFIVILNNTNSTSSNFKRVLTNVADGSSIYQAMVNAPLGMKVVIQPETLSFAGKYSKAEFNMTVSINMGADDVSPKSDYIGNFGFLTWYEVNGNHKVRSPIVSAFAP